MGQFPICKLKCDLLRTFVTACTIDENIFCPIWNLLCENGNLRRNFSKKVIYKPLMGCSLFSNSHFQTGVTVMGFAEHFGHNLLVSKYMNMILVSSFKRLLISENSTFRSKLNQESLVNLQKFPFSYFVFYLI